MADPIATLRALLTLDSAAFERGGKRAEASLSAMQTKMRRVSQDMQRLGSRISRSVSLPLATIGTVAVTTSLATVDAQAKLAQSLDTSVQSMQVLTRAGDLAGVSFSGVEQATKDMTRRLSQAAGGTGPAVDALDRLNLSAQDLLDLSLDQRVATINAAIEQFVPRAERAAVAGQLFGEEGSIAIARLDPATIRRATDEIARFGVGVSEVDAVAIQEANDAISQLGLVSRGLGNQLAAALAPALTAIANSIASVADRFSNLSESTKTFVTIVGSLAIALGPVTVALGAVGVALSGLPVILTSVGAIAAAVLSPVGLGIAAVVALGAGVAVIINRLGGFGSAMSFVRDLASDVWDRIRQGGALLGEALDAVALGIQGAFVKTFGRIQSSFRKLMSLVYSSLNSLGTDIDSSLFEDGSDLEGQGQRMLDASQAILGSVRESASILGSGPLEALESLKTTVQSTGKDLEGTSQKVQGLAEALSSSGSGAGGLSQSAQDAAVSVEGLSQNMEDERLERLGNEMDRLSGVLLDRTRDIRSFVNSALAEFGRFHVSQGLRLLLGLPMADSGGGLLGDVFGSFVKPFAKGAAFENGVERFASGAAFANSIVTRPTRFNAAEMGEKGPEGILPLARTSDGSLGVRSVGGGERQTVVRLVLDQGLMAELVRGEAQVMIEQNNAATARGFNRAVQRSTADPKRR